MFADDTIVFCEATADQILFLSWVFFWFEALSSLKINRDKKELIPMGRVDNVGKFAAEFSRRVGSLPTTYLGLPSGTTHKSVVVWDDME